MTTESLNRAIEVNGLIKRLNSFKADVVKETHLKSTSKRIPKEVLEAGRQAMLAVLDESISALQTELAGL